jgi:hypothetical protein
MSDPGQQVKQKSAETMWLVFAKQQPPASFHLIRANSGIWWGKASTESHALALVTQLHQAGISAWFKYEADMPTRLSKSSAEARNRDFSEYRTNFRNPVPAVEIRLDPNRDRSSGRRNYAQIYAPHVADVGT